MYASQCINPEIPYLQPEDKGLTALSLLEELKISEMALVSDDKYIGLVKELDLLDYECIDGQIKDLGTKLKRPFVDEKDHLFEAVSLMAAENLTVLPVLSGEEKYVGCIDLMSVVKIIASSEGYSSLGGVIELEMGVTDYSMAEISRLVESNDIKIIHAVVNSSPDSKLIRVTLKLNTSNLSPLIRTFERYNYTITASYQEDEYEEDLKKRYDSFLRYLNI